VFNLDSFSFVCHMLPSFLNIHAHIRTKRGSKISNEKKIFVLDAREGLKFLGKGV
jgi:hypothetical protein